jgi:hypothetical protein
MLSVAKFSLFPGASCHLDSWHRRSLRRVEATSAFVHWHIATVRGPRRFGSNQRESGLSADIGEPTRLTRTGSSAAPTGVGRQRESRHGPDFGSPERLNEGTTHAGKSPAAHLGSAEGLSRSGEAPALPREPKREHILSLLPVHLDQDGFLDGTDRGGAAKRKPRPRRNGSSPFRKLQKQLAAQKKPDSAVNAVLLQFIVFGRWRLKITIHR